VGFVGILCVLLPARGAMNTEEGSQPAAQVDIVFARHASGTRPPEFRFVEVEDTEGNSLNFGEWVERTDGYWALRIPLSRPDGRSDFSWWAGFLQAVMPLADTEHLEKVVPVALKLMGLCGDRGAATHWLQSEIPALGNQRPITVMATPEGIVIIDDLIERGLAGVYM
jgi:hypothetical protein